MVGTVTLSGWKYCSYYFDIEIFPWYHDSDVTQHSHRWIKQCLFVCFWGGEMIKQKLSDLIWCCSGLWLTVGLLGCSLHLLRTSIGKFSIHRQKFHFLVRPAEIVIFPSLSVNLSSQISHHHLLLELWRRRATHVGKYGIIFVSSHWKKKKLSWVTEVSQNIFLSDVHATAGSWNFNSKIMLIYMLSW